MSFRDKTTEWLWSGYCKVGIKSNNFSISGNIQKFTAFSNLVIHEDEDLTVFKRAVLLFQMKWSDAFLFEKMFFYKTALQEWRDLD